MTGGFSHLHKRRPRRGQEGGKKRKRKRGETRRKGKLKLHVKTCWDLSLTPFVCEESPVVQNCQHSDDSVSLKILLL